MTLVNRMAAQGRALLILPLVGLLGGRAEGAEPVEVSCGVVFSISAPQAYANWASVLPYAMGGTEWNRLMFLHYSPFVVLKNTTNRPVVLSSNPTVLFSQPPVGFKFKRIAATMAGDITSTQVASDQMYVYSHARGNKTYSMTLFNEVSNGTGSGKVSLQAGQTRILTPAFTNSVMLGNRHDWQNNLTSALKATPGWAGCGNGFCIDYLSGGNTTSLNGNLAVITSRSTDSWDVESGFTGAQGGWRVFRLQPDGSPPAAPDSALEITGFPFNLSDIEGTVSASSMAVNLSLPAYNQPIHAMFSVLGTPTSATTLSVLADSDANGLPDEWEMLHFNQLGVSPTEDADGDGLSNHFEYVSGHSPVNGNDHFIQQLARLENGHLSLTWSSIPGRSYVIEQSGDLGTWTPFATIPAAASPATTTTMDLVPATTGSQFYRIRLTAAP